MQFVKVTCQISKHIPKYNCTSSYNVYVTTVINNPTGSFPAFEKGQTIYDFIFNDYAARIW